MKPDHDRSATEGGRSEFLRALVDDIQDAIIAVDASGRVTLANRSALDMFGEWLGQHPGPDVWLANLQLHYSDGRTPLEEADVPLLRAWRGEHVTDAEITVVRDDVPRTLEFRCQPLIGPERMLIGAVSVARDVTERRQMQRQIEESNRLASLGKLSAAVAHEFNNVLMSIQPFAEVLRRRVKEKDAGIERALEAIGAAVRRGKQITDEVMRFARPAEPVLEPIEVRQWMCAMEGDLRSLVGSSIDVLMKLPDEDLYIDADRAHLHQVFLQLAMNARDAMPAGGLLTIAAVPGVSYESLLAFGVIPTPDRYVHFLVSDTGSGLSPEARRHAFDPLFTTHSRGRTGLGLSIARQIVLKHNGLIFLESEEGSGTTVHAFIPSALPTGEVRSAMAAESVARQNPLRILVVEDDPLVVEGITAVLESAGHTVQSVGTGAEVAEALRRFSPEAVVLDVGLPDMDGTHVYAELRREYPRLPVVFSTGHAEGVKNEGDQSPVALLLKPYSSDTLLRILWELASRS